MQNEKQASFESYKTFWPFYLSQHRKPATRRMHILGTLCGLVALGAAIFFLSFKYLLVALLLGYGFAWVSHRHIEKNHPATFTYPVWSLMGDFHMVGLWLIGRLDAELKHHHITD